MGQAENFRPADQAQFGPGESGSQSTNSRQGHHEIPDRSAAHHCDVEGVIGHIFLFGDQLLPNCPNSAIF